VLGDTYFQRGEPVGDSTQKLCRFNWVSQRVHGGGRDFCGTEIQHSFEIVVE
jgi:hypothetical protein